jgi:large subunit ribosomal protein L22
MVTRALEKYLRISPKKLRIIAGLLKEKNVEEAIYALVNTNKKGAAILKKVVESALSNAKRIPEKKFTEKNLYISKVAVNPGPMLKRFRAMSMGRAGMIRKRTSHVLIELDAVKGKK